MKPPKTATHTHMEACIVIPIFKEKLTETESVSFNQCLRVLHRHPIIIIKPRSLDRVWLPDGITRAVDFEDIYFSGLEGYNRLMLTPEFYGAFMDEFRMMLVYQLDAFVFEDQLLYWCNSGYDYIGAPWPYEVAPPDFFKKVKVRLRNYYAIKFNKIDKESHLPHRYQIEGRVGNGGFSLRNIRRFYEIACREKQTIDRYLSHNHHHYHEDVFWGIEVNRKYRQLRIPNAAIAKKFSFENFPERLYAENNYKLPFGCHGWDMHVPFWRPIFNGIGYRI